MKRSGSETRQLAIIGGKAAGPAAAAAASRANPDANIVLFEQHDAISYGVCELPMLLSNEVERADDLIVNSPEAFRESYGVDVRTNTRVLRVDAEEKRLVYAAPEGAERTQRFDAIVFANGTSPIVPDALRTDAPNVWTFRHLHEARAVDDYLDANDVHHAVVVGAGYIGLEAAEALSLRGIRVTVLEAAGKAMPGALDDPSADVLAERLRKAGLTVRFEAATGYDTRSDGRVQAVRTDAGEKIGCQLVLLGTGVRAAGGLAEEAGIKVDSAGRIKVTDEMQTSARGIWACGDVVTLPSVYSEHRIWVPLALPGYHSGRVAGHNAARQGRGAAKQMHAVVPTYGLKVFDTEVGISGILSDVQAKEYGYDPVSVHISHINRPSMLEHGKVAVSMMADRTSRRVLGASFVGADDAALRANAVSMAIRMEATVDDLYKLDTVYTPRLAPMHDPITIAARQLQKKLSR